MFIEKRRQLRLDTHIPAEITIMDALKKLNGYFFELGKEYSDFHYEESQKFCGYVKNLSEGGIGVSSLEPLVPGTSVIASIGPLGTEMISPAAVLIFSRLDGQLHYYGFKFTLVKESERVVLKRFLRVLTLTARQ